MTSLFTPLSLRSITSRNRIVVSPMCQYSAGLGLANDWHFAHLARFALGGFGIVILEATAVTPEGRISHGDLGLWNDAQIIPLAHIAAFLKTHGAVPAIQLAHAGRKASCQRPWEGGKALTEHDRIARSEGPWPTLAPSAIGHTPEDPTPQAMDDAGLSRIRDAFIAATKRAQQAGFEMVEVHCAHGYLLNQFLSPLANQRTDQYGGSRENRMRFPLEIVDAVRANWPEALPLFVRISAVDGVENGTGIEDSIAFAQALKQRGVDVVDCSSGGISPHYIYPTGPGYQVPYAEQIKQAAGIPTMAVGLITEASQAARILETQQADLVALAREALVNPNWPLHAQQALNATEDTTAWPIQVRSRLSARKQQLAGKAS